jgi:hypothetical protein
MTSLVPSGKICTTTAGILAIPFGDNTIIRPSCIFSIGVNQAAISSSVLVAFILEIVINKYTYIVSLSLICQT